MTKIKEKIMNRLLLLPSERVKNSSYYEISCPEKLSHLINHLKMEKGKALKVSILNLGVGEGLILSCHSKKIEIEVHSISSISYPEISLFVGISRPPTLKKILEHGATLGVTHFHFFNCTLTEKSFLESKILKTDMGRNLTYLGLSQSAIYWKEPKISVYKNIRDLPVSSGLLLSPKAPQNVSDIQDKIKNKQEISLVIGPERGFTIEEESFFLKKDFKSIKIHPSVLRVEQAVYVSLGQIALYLSI